jgi:GxxExxY protein
MNGGSRYVLTEREEEIASVIVQTACSIHRELGPGLLEHVYEVAFCHRLAKAGLKCERQVIVPLVFDGIEFDEAFRLDVLVHDLIICEIKATDEITSAHKAQLLTYLRLTGKRVGFILNFNADLMKHGLRRLVT